MREVWLDRYRHRIACATSIILTSAGVYFLSSLPAPTAYERATFDDEPLTIVWIERRPERVALRPAKIEPQRPSEPSGPRFDAVRTRRDVPLTATNTSASDRVPVAPAHAPLDLRLHEPKIEIATAADARIVRVPVDALEPPSLLSVRVEDRSFGAFLSGASRGMECAELRAALRKQPASSNTIIESMRKRGCK
jgi:hypothetical protein